VESGLVSARPLVRAGTTGRSAAGIKRVLLAESSPVPVERGHHGGMCYVWVLVLNIALFPFFLMSAVLSNIVMWVLLSHRWRDITEGGSQPFCSGDIFHQCFR
jgi:hypothetical protein